MPNHCNYCLMHHQFLFGFPSHYILTSNCNEKCRSAAIAKGSQSFLAYFCMEYINSIIWNNNNLRCYQNKIDQRLRAKGNQFG